MLRWTLVCIFLLIPAASAHDHDKPGLNHWFSNLKSKISFCCDGSEAVHLKDVEWQTQNKPGSHYKVKIPATANEYQNVLHGLENVPTVWVDVPDAAVLEEPNLDGDTLVWPMYIQWNVPGVRCFMPGPET